MAADNRIRVFIGHYGSGKTEIAVNYALMLASTGRKVALVDLDVVNPFFRSREKRALLEAADIWVIGNSLGIDKGVDLPAIPAEVTVPLQDISWDVILDVGGNSAGARALARYRRFMQPGDYDMFCVVNAFRPETRDPEGVVAHAEAIAETVGAPLTAMINNSHILLQTSVDLVLHGQRVCKRAADKLGLPIRYVSVMQRLAGDLPAKDLEGAILPIQIHMREDWM
ncbi:ATP-binding protein [bacterium]|nr:ATP-binding protein [bacterium]